MLTKLVSVIAYFLVATLGVVLFVGFVANVLNGDIAVPELFLWSVLFSFVFFCFFIIKNAKTIFQEVLRSKKEIMLVTGVLVLVFASFYWFQWRPSQIKANCIQRFYDLCQNSSLGYDKCVKKFQFSGSEALDRSYKQCLHENGL